MHGPHATTLGLPVEFKRCSVGIKRSFVPPLATPPTGWAVDVRQLRATDSGVRPRYIRPGDVFPDFKCTISVSPCPLASHSFFD